MKPMVLLLRRCHCSQLCRQGLLLGALLSGGLGGLAGCEGEDSNGPGERVLASNGAMTPLEIVNTDVESLGKTIRVNAGGDFQRALERASPGDVIELEAGAVFRGPYLLPKKSAAATAAGQWITIQPRTTVAELPPPGVRVTPVDAPAMPILETTSGAVLTTAAGAHHYRLIGMLIRPAESLLAQGKTLNTLVNFGSSSRRSDALPHHLIIERSLLLGDPELGTRRGVILNSADSAVIDSHFSDFKVRGEDAQAIIGWSGPGPYRIENNYLEAAGENLMFGGGDPHIANTVPTDIEIVGNHFTKPLAWRGNSSWTVKNLLELKNARRVRIDGNLFEYNWPQAQNGFAILFTVRNQEGSAPWSVVEDVTFSNNIVRHIANGVNILGYDDNQQSQQTRRIHLRNNLFEDLGGEWGDGHFVQLLDGTADIAVQNNTVLNDGRAIFAEGRPHAGFVFRNNIVMHRQYGIVGTGSAPGEAVLQRYFPDVVMSGNWIIDGPLGFYPSGNRMLDSLSDVGFNDLEGGDYRIEQGELAPAGVDFSELCAALSTTEQPIYCPLTPPGQP